MDSLPPLFASAQDAETSKEDVGTAMAAQPITDTEPITETTGHRDPQADPQSELASPVVAPTPINPALLHQPNDIQLYSPTKAEIESHPIRQRLSIVQDNSDTAIGAAHPDSPSPLEESNSLRQVEEGSERPETVAMSDAPKEGDQVVWDQLGSGPPGTVKEVSDEQVKMTTKRGNEVKKNAKEGDPAVYIERPGGAHDVVKNASETEVTKEGEGSSDKKEEKKENGEAETGDKRKAEDTAEEKNDEEEGDAKKQKTAKEPKENGEKPKKKGRPAKNANGAGGAKKETKKREPKKAATESGQPRRSGRNAGKSD